MDTQQPPASNTTCSFCKATVRAAETACPVCSYPENGTATEQNAFKDKLRFLVSARDKAKSDTKRGRKVLLARVLFMSWGLMIDFSLVMMLALPLLAPNMPNSIPTQPLWAVLGGGVLGLSSVGLWVGFLLAYFRYTVLQPPFGFRLAFGLEMGLMLNRIGWMFVFWQPAVVFSLAGFIVALFIMAPLFNAIRSSTKLAELEERLDFYRSVRGVETSSGL